MAEVQKDYGRKKYIYEQFNQQQNMFERKIKVSNKKREIRHTGKNLTREGRKIIPKKKGRKKKEKQERKGVSQEEYIPKKGSEPGRIYTQERKQEIKNISKNGRPTGKIFPRKKGGMKE